MNSLLVDEDAMLVAVAAVVAVVLAVVAAAAVDVVVVYRQMTSACGHRVRLGECEVGLRGRNLPHPTKMMSKRRRRLGSLEMPPRVKAQR